MREFKKKLLESFRDLKITRNELFSKLINENSDQDRLIVYNKDLIFVLNQYIEKKIDQQKLLEWVNTIEFSDLYKRCTSESNSFGSVIYELEEIDEHDKLLSNDEAFYYIDALNKNIETDFFIPKE